MIEFDRLSHRVGMHCGASNSASFLGGAVSQPDALRAFEDKFDAAPLERASQLFNHAIRAWLFRILQANHRPLGNPRLLGQLRLGEANPCACGSNLEDVNQDLALLVTK